MSNKGEIVHFQIQMIASGNHEIKSQHTRMKQSVRILTIISSPEPKAQGELIVYQTSRRLSVCLSVCLWTFSNLNISATIGPIVTKF